MGMLGRSELIKKLANGSLVISPILSKEQIGAASIDLRLGNVALVVRARGSSHVDPMREKESNTNGSRHVAEFRRMQKYERYEIPFNEKFLLHPGSLVLMPTLEWVKLPQDLHGSVTARSTWAREGLSIATAIFVEPSYQGIVTLELANLGEIPIAIYPGMRVAQIAFSMVEGDTQRPKSGQFSLSFEPKQGNIAPKEDDPFIPDPSHA
jgi:dCTP deaminase